MREHNLLSPHRPRRKPDDAHQRQIITTAPNVMWAIDATQVTTVQHGKVWIFGVAEHWNAELLGWHVTKSGTRLPPCGRCLKARGDPGPRHGHPPAIRPPLRRRRPRPRAPPRPWQQLHGRPLPQAGPVLGHLAELRLRRRTADQRRHREAVSHDEGFGALPRTAIHGRGFQTIDEVRDAVRAFAARYNAEWLIEKNGYLSPLDARAARLDTTFTRAA